MAQTEREYETLRSKAEELLAKRQPGTELLVSDIATLVHELEVHHIELEMQNEELGKAYHKAEEEASRYADLYNNAPNGYFTLNRHWEILEANAMGAKMLGSKAQSLAHTRFEFYVAEADRDRFYLCMQTILASGAGHACEIRIKQRDGSVLWAELRGVVTGGGKTCLVTAVDISERKEHERRRKLVETLSEDIKEREQIEEELRRYQAELLRTKAEQEEQNHELEAIVSFVSHDLRTPLVNIRGFGNELQKDYEVVKRELSKIALPDEARRTLSEVMEKHLPESLGFIQNSAAYMNQIVNSFVKVSRAGLAEIRPETIDMKKLIEEVAGNLEHQVKESGATVIVGELPPCRADMTQMSQVFSNLLSNSLKYLEPGRGGRIEISGRKSGGETVYVVEDNGIGIAEHEFEKIFEMFYQHGDRHVGGEGIGLSLVKRLVERNKGHIRVESEKGKGSRFFISMPGAE